MAICTRLRVLVVGVLGLVIAAGCGLKTGYAPAEVPVHRGVGTVASPAGIDSLTVVSWNIQYAEEVGLALSEIRADSDLASADILLLQEMDPLGSARIAEELGYYYVHASASVSPRSKKLFGNAVLSRWPIVDDEILTLPHATPLTGHRRIAVAADIDLGDGRLLRAVSVHTATMVVPQEQRFEQIRALGGSLAGVRDLIIIGGDFNTVSDYECTQLRRLMRDHGLAAVRLPSGPTIRNRYKKLPGSVPVLDHIFVRGFATGPTGVSRSTSASDHYPVWARLLPKN